MLFNSQIFLVIFLPLTALLFYTCKGQETKKLMLIFLSFVFYGWWDVRFLPLLIFSIMVNWLIVKFWSAKPWVLRLTVVGNLLLLGFYKYLNFILETLEIFTGDLQTKFSLVLPLGISFFTFQQISYLLDVKNKKAPIYSLADYSFYLSFFPQLIAGPIVRHHEILPQLKNTSNIHYHSISMGIMLLTIGLIKKLFLADTLAPITYSIFEAAKWGHLPASEALFACLGFGMQIYFDFSGYSDMAMGLGKIFGFELPANFNSPYQALSIRDFWQRWHITLSNFLRDYIYIPLGGNRSGNLKQYRNLLITMSLAGLWHGAGWNFILWGGLHGLALIFNHLWRNFQFHIPKILSWGVTMGFVFLTWILFRSETFYQAGHILASFLNFNDKLIHIEKKHFLLLLPAFLILSSKINALEFIEKIKPKTSFGLLLGVLWIICVLTCGGQAPIEFIYFQF